MLPSTLQALKVELVALGDTMTVRLSDQETGEVSLMGGSKDGAHDHAWDIEP